MSKIRETFEGMLKDDSVSLADTVAFRDKHSKHFGMEDRVKLLGKGFRETQKHCDTIISCCSNFPDYKE